MVDNFKIANTVTVYDLHSPYAESQFKYSKVDLANDKSQNEE